MPDAHLERLLTELGERARGEITAVDADADERIASLRAEWAQRFVDERERALAECERRAASDAAGEIAALKRDRRSVLLGAQHTLVERVLARASLSLASCFEHAGGHRAVASHIDMLREFAGSPDVEVSVSSRGITMTADGGHLRIDDSIDAWLAAERPRLAIDICRMAESTTCSSHR
jgi:hypothetical protein